MNVAMHLRRQGISSVMISAVGDDENGRALLDYVQSNALDSSFIQTHSTLPTGTVAVDLDAQGQATYTIIEPVAWDAIQFLDRDAIAVKEGGAFVFGTLALRNAASRDTLLKLIEHAKIRVFDMNIRPPFFEPSLIEKLLDKTDVLKINEHELDWLIKQFKLAGAEDSQLLVQLATKFNIRIVCVTLGDKGAMVLHGGHFFRHPGFAVTVADTVGAGDAFLAAFIAGLLARDPLQETLGRACATGAFVASKAGANPEYTNGDIVRFLC